MEVGLSPGINTLKYAEKCMNHRLQVEKKSQQPSTKRRRLILKQECATSQGAQEALEGATYQSGIDMQAEADIQQLPDAITHGEFKPVRLSDGSPTVIAIDLETTDLIRGGQVPHITQIAAINIEGQRLFEMYVIPKVPIAFDAQQATGISYVNNMMTVNGNPVEAYKIQHAMQSLCEWLEKFQNVILIAHNGRRFDFPVLVTAASNTGLLQRLTNCVAGCLDTLSLFKKVFPDRTSYKQEDLVLGLLNTQYNAHNALDDVCSLGSLFKFADLTDEEYMKFTFSPKAVHLNQLYLIQKSKNMPSLSELVAHGVCKRATAENIAGSGLNLQHLKTIYSREGEDGLMNVFTGKNSEGQPRITNTKRILENVIPKLVDYFSK